MVRECYKTNTGILFSDAALRQIGLDPMLYSSAVPKPPVSIDNKIDQPVDMPVHVETDSSTTDSSTEISEEEEELKDALTRVHDQLEESWTKMFWWILELLPFQQRYCSKNGAWRSKISCVF